MKTLKRTFSVLLILAVFLLALPLSPAAHAAQPLPSSVSVDLQDADFGSYNTSYTNSSVGAFNPLITNTGKESLQVSSYYMKISLISGDTDAFTVGWNAGTGTCRPGYKCSKGYIRVNNGLSAGTYTATLAFSYDYDGTGSDYDWIIVKTSTVSITITPSQTCVVSFDKNGGVDNYSNHGVVKNSVYTLPNCIIMPPSGKTFDQWEVTVGSNAAVRKNPGDSVTITDDTTVKALWKEKVLAAELENVYLNNATSKIAYEGYSAMDYRMLFGISITGTETLNCDEDHLKIELTGEDADAFNIWVSHSSYDAPGNSYNAGTLYPAYGLTAGSYTANLKLSYDEDGLGTTYAWKVLDDTKTVSFTVYELTQIDSAAVTITPPSVGANPDYNAGLPDDALYHLELNDLNTIVNSVSWFDQTAEKWIEPTDSFEAGHIYNVRIDLHPDEGASFSSDCIATVNGNPAEVRLRELEEETYLRVEYTFPQLVSETPEKPVITDVSNVSNGVKISWNAVPGAAKYAVYRKGPNDTAFKKLATTAELSFTNRSVASGKTYRYSVRAVTSDGIMSGYSAGKSILYLRIPVIQSIENVSTGVKLAWDAVGGAAKYYIYRKGPGETSFTKLVATTELSYTNKSVVSGKEYRYSVRAVTADGTTLSAYSAGQSIKFMKAPVFTLENVSTGVKLSWSAVGGASKYYIYRKAPGETGFTKLVATSDLTYTNRSVTAGKEYRYAIRSVASDGTLSAYSAGKSITYQKP